MNPTAATTAMSEFRYEAVKGRNWLHTAWLRIAHGWQNSDTGSCNEYVVRVGTRLFGGWFGLALALLTGRAVVWQVWSGKKPWPSHTALWVKGMGWTDSSHPEWRTDFRYFARVRAAGGGIVKVEATSTNQTRCIPLTLGPIPYILTAGLWCYGEVYLAGVAGLWMCWAPARILMGLRLKGAK
jgi:hypothetical protein